MTAFREPAYPYAGPEPGEPCEDCNKGYVLPEREACTDCPLYWDIRKPLDAGEPAPEGCMGCDWLETCDVCHGDLDETSAEREADRECHAREDEEALSE